MGEAKRRREEFRQRALVDIERWMMPNTPEEQSLLEEVLKLKSYTIERASKSIMDYCLMKPQECHKNAWGYCGSDPSGESQVVSGWWKRHGPGLQPVYAFHSVVKNKTGMFCITPYFDEATLVFLPDPSIEWITDNGNRYHQRNGVPLPYGLRENPGQVIAEATLVRDQLLSGMNPWEAIKIAS